jgi:hypothetical protein
MMADPPLTGADEHAHPPGADPDWEESWSFDFVSADGRVGGYARLGLRPHEGRAWWWSAVVGTDLPFVLVREHEVDLPRPGTFEIRAPGLWAEPVCETPFEHWGLGLEAFGVALDDPLDAYGDERGEPVPLGLDLEWEPYAAPAVWARVAGRTRYGQAGAVHGEVLVGRGRFPVAGAGTTEHAWGPRSWWSAENDPGRAAGNIEGAPVGPGPDVRADLTLDGRGLISGGRIEVPGGPSATVRPARHAPLRIPAPDGRASRLARALCTLDAADGRTGWAWAERLQPA